MRVAINGFGRIGRLTLRALLKRQPDIEIAAINDLAEPLTNAHLFRYDSNYGPYAGVAALEGDTLVVDGRRIGVHAENDWSRLDWGGMGVDLVIEATGAGSKRAMAAKHLTGGARKVLISAPSAEADVTIVLGVNQDAYDPEKHHIISNASCTTNGLAPPLKVIHDGFGVLKAQMTTVHSYTNTQGLLDRQTKDLRDARAAALSIVPAATGAARAIELVIPALKGKLDGASYRVPTPTVSIVEFVALLGKKAEADEINAALREAAEGPMSGILDVAFEPLVSMDLKANEHSSIVDALSTNVVDGNLAKVAAWYDNEWGYACRMADAAAYIMERVPTGAAR